MTLREKLFKLLGVLVIAVSFASAWIVMDLRAFAYQPINKTSESVYYVVEKGMNLNRIANDLVRRELIKSPHYLVWLARWLGGADKIHAGEYEIKPGILPEDFLKMLSDGKVIQYSLTLVEGWNFRQVMDAIKTDEHMVHTLDNKTDAEIMALLGRANQHPEGQFFPDTYKFSRDMSDLEFLRRAMNAMDEVVKNEWDNRAMVLPYNNPYEALIMASIIEKETGLPSERKAIAGVFVRRLEKGMRLQTDPTVIYGMGENYNGNIRRRDLEEENPYNTYRINGLPPTPIAMPGRQAIHAALNPAEGEELYFVAKGDGSHHFSTTLDEHNQAVIQYQLKGKPRAFSSMNTNKEASE